MQAVVDALWGAFADHGVSWAGFYHVRPDEPPEARLELGPRRDKPACSPIGVHGVCGQAATVRATMIIHDVADLGESYIACDPRDRSEIVVPIIDQAGECVAVLDVDSHEVGSFGEADDAGLRLVLKRAGFTPA